MQKDLQSFCNPGTCPGAFFSDGSPVGWRCSFPLRGLYRTYVRCPAYAPERCVCFCFFRLYVAYPVYAPARCVSFTPRGGGQRDRDGFANPSLPLRHLSTEPRLRGSPLAAGLITANRVVYTNIVCAIPVLSFIATSMYRLGALCSGWYRLRFSRDVRLVSCVFHLC